MADLDNDALISFEFEKENAEHAAIKSKLADALSGISDPDKIGAALFTALLDQIPNLKRPRSSAIFMTNLMATQAGLPKPFGTEDYASLGEPNG
jgi:hypothetical protein